MMRGPRSRKGRDMTSIDPGAGLLTSVPVGAMVEPALKRAEPRPNDRERSGREDRQSDFTSALNSAAGAAGVADRVPESSRPAEAEAAFRAGTQAGGQSDAAGDRNTAGQSAQQSGSASQASDTAGREQEAARPASDSAQTPGAGAQGGSAGNRDGTSAQAGSVVTSGALSGTASEEAIRQVAALDRLASLAGAEEVELKLEEVSQADAKPASGSIRFTVAGNAAIRGGAGSATGTLQGTNSGVSPEQHSGADTTSPNHAEVGTGRNAAAHRAEAQNTGTEAVGGRGAAGESLGSLQKGQTGASHSGSRSGQAWTASAAPGEDQAQGRVTKSGPAIDGSSNSVRESGSAMRGAAGQGSVSGTDSGAPGQHMGSMMTEGEGGSQSIGKVRNAGDPLSSESPSRTPGSAGGRTAPQPGGDSTGADSRAGAYTRESGAGSVHAARSESSGPGAGQSSGTSTDGSAIGSGNSPNAAGSGDGSARFGSAVDAAPPDEALPAVKPAPARPAGTTGESAGQRPAAHVRQNAGSPAGVSAPAPAPAGGAAASIAEGASAAAGSQDVSEDGQIAGNPNSSPAKPASIADGSGSPGRLAPAGQAEEGSSAASQPVDSRAVRDQRGPAVLDRVAVGDRFADPANPAGARGQPAVVSAASAGEGSHVEVSGKAGTDQIHGRSADDLPGAAASARLEHSSQPAPQAAGQPAGPHLQSGADSPTGPRILDVTEMPEFLPHTLRAAVRDGVREANIRLWPPELGALKVQLQVNGDLVTARIQAERPDAYALLERMRGALQKGMQESGLTLHRLEIDLGGSTAVRAASSSNAGQFERDSDPSQRNPMDPGHGSRNGASSSSSHESRQQTDQQDGRDAGSSPASPLIRGGRRGDGPAGKAAERVDGVDAWA